MTDPTTGSGAAEQQSPASIEHISDTARWVAVYRAMETARPDAIFRDPYAERLAGPRGQAIVDSMPQGRERAWSFTIRTALFDEIILGRVREHGVDLVLNLAAGLDARPWRLELPPELRWVDVDLPEMLHYKTEILRDERPVCRYEAVPMDLRDEDARRALFARLGGEAERVLIVTEGLLVYLSNEEVGALATDLHAQPSLRWWTFDIGSPGLLKMIQDWAQAVAMSGAPFKFAPAEGTKFFEPFGWREAEYYSMVEEAFRRNRPPPTPDPNDTRAAEAMKSMSWEEVRRFSGFALLLRDDT